MTQVQTLFRQRALAGAVDPVFGSVTAVVPPSGFVGAVLAVVVLCVIVGVAILVRMPLKTEAAGVLMPPGGLVDVIAVADGRIVAVHTGSNSAVQSGEPMFEIAVHSAVVEGVSSAQFRLQSIQREADQLQRIRAARARVFNEQLGGLQQELEAIDGRRQLLVRQLRTLQDAQAAAESRLARYVSLADEGHVSRDELDRQRAALLRDNAAQVGSEQQVAGLDVERQSLVTRISALQREQEVSVAEFELRLEQLSRDIEDSTSQQHYSVRSPQAGVIESLLVSRGALVRKGQVLARLSGGEGILEAWLYVPSSSARSLRAGQTVELRLDAFPRSVFGSRTATVYSVTSIPIAPEAVTAPLSLAVPVFEIRARLDHQPAPPTHGRWSIPPGTTFRASILQRRLRLYEWLFRNRRTLPADRNA